MAAADKRGVFDAIIGPASSPASPILDTKARRAMTVKRATDFFDILINFACSYAPDLFANALPDIKGGMLRDPSLRLALDKAKAEFVEMAPYFSAVNNYMASKPELFALSHVNLQVDNAFFWRKDDTEDLEALELECGLLDWYNTSRAPSVGVWMGCLSGIEPDVLLAHEEGLTRCYSAEYYKHGGPLVDPDELRLQMRLTMVTSFLGNLQYIESEILKDMPSKAEWNSVKSHWDPLVMGKWNVRCRTVAIMQMLAYYLKAPLHDTFMEWVAEHPDLCKEPAK